MELILAMLLSGAVTLQTPDLTVRVRNKQGQLVRSRARVCQFLRVTGHVKRGQRCRVPEGYRVDHHTPLFCGGADIPSNMALLTISEHAAKSLWERRPCSAWWDGTYTRLIQAGIERNRVVPPEMRVPDVSEWRHAKPRETP